MDSWIYFLPLFIASDMSSSLMDFPHLSTQMMVLVATLTVLSQHPLVLVTFTQLLG